VQLAERADLLLDAPEPGGELLAHRTSLPR